MSASFGNSSPAKAGVQGHERSAKRLWTPAFAGERKMQA